MARTGRPTAPLVVTDEERKELERLARRARSNRSLAMRAKIVLHCGAGLPGQVVASQLHVSAQTVCKWRKRFLEQRVAALYDEPRPGAPRKITDKDVEEIVSRTLETKPKGRTHWSTRKMAQTAGISHTSVGRIWRTFALQPHVVRSFKFSEDPLFIEKVRDIVGLYMNPPEHAVVFSFDEKPQIQALERAQPVLPMDLGMPERQTHNYIRRGTLDLFAALNVATGKVLVATKQRHAARDFVDFLREIDRHVQPDLDVHVILDNLSAHKAPVVKRWHARHPRFHFHFTPTYSSWLNLVERFFGLLTEHALRRGSHRSVPDLRLALQNYVEAHNEDGKVFKWTKTADEILDSVKRFGQRTLLLHGGGDAPSDD